MATIELHRGRKKTFLALSPCLGAKGPPKGGEEGFEDLPETRRSVDKIKLKGLLIVVGFIDRETFVCLFNYYYIFSFLTYISVYARVSKFDVGLG